MKGLIRTGVLAVMGMLLAGGGAVAGTITQYTDASSFNTAMGVPLYVEDFTNSVHYPITTGTLNSTTNLTVSNGTPITPGMILPGVTYSTPKGSGNFFNIDAGQYFTGGFLDRTTGGSNDNSNVGLTTTFDRSVQGFGFLASPLMGTEFWITIHFTSGSDYSSSAITIPGGGTSFFGFVSSATDIASATLYGNSSTRPFTIDNFTYAKSAAVPEPSSIVSASVAMLVGAGIAVARRRRDSRSR